MDVVFKRKGLSFFKRKGFNMHLLKRKSFKSVSAQEEGRVLRVFSFTRKSFKGVFVQEEKF